MEPVLKVNPGSCDSKSSYKLQLHAHLPMMLSKDFKRESCFYTACVKTRPLSSPLPFSRHTLTLYHCYKLKPKHLTHLWSADGLCSGLSHSTLTFTICHMGPGNPSQQMETHMGKHMYTVLIYTDPKTNDILYAVKHRINTQQYDSEWNQPFTDIKTNMLICTFS